MQITHEAAFSRQLRALSRQGWLLGLERQISPPAGVFSGMGRMRTAANGAVGVDDTERSAIAELNTDRAGTHRHGNQGGGDHQRDEEKTEHKATSNAAACWMLVIHHAGAFPLNGSDHCGRKDHCDECEPKQQVDHFKTSPSTMYSASCSI